MKRRDYLWWYLCVVFVLSYAWQYVIYRTGGVESRLFIFLNWFPGIIALFFIILTKADFRNIGWGLRRWQFIFPSVFIPMLVVLGLCFLLAGLDWGHMPNRLFVFEEGMLEKSRIGLLLGNHRQPIGFFLVNLVISHIVFLIGGSLTTLGEEFGWRGYAQERFLRKYGLVWGFAVLGAIWGYWHLPIVLMGYNFPNQPILGALLLMPMGTTFIGIFLGWLYLRSRSIWMPALAHASANLFSGLLFGMKMHHHEMPRQLLWIAAWGVVAAVCLLDTRRNRPMLWQEVDSAAESR